MSGVGRVAQLWVFPVKSMSGASVAATEVRDGGLAGDRSWAVVDDAGETVTAAEVPQLRQVTTRLVDVYGGAPPALDHVESSADHSACTR